MKRAAIAFAISVIIVAVLVTAWAITREKPDVLGVGTLWVLTLTLMVLVWYAYDTHRIAQVTSERWTREGVLNTTYEIKLVGSKEGDGRTLFRIHNGSNLVVRAKVNCNLRVYGEPVKAGALYDGEDTWRVFPQEFAQGWFEVSALVKQKGKDVAQMVKESTQQNRGEQLTMLLELEYTDELSAHRKLPPREYYFDFFRWAWIPHLAAPIEPSA